MLIPNLDKAITRKENHRPITHRGKNHKQYFSKSNPIMNKKDDNVITKWYLYQECQVSLTFTNQSL